MTVRPGWGDRRQCIQSTIDFRTWSGPESLLQPDALDEELIELLSEHGLEDDTEAGDIIMAARAHWFADEADTTENADADPASAASDN